MSIPQLPPSTGINFVSTLHSDCPDHLQPSQQPLPRDLVVCVTGASRGIGAATAKAFAAAGATGLILTARKETSLETTKKECQRLATAKGLKITTLGNDGGSAEGARVLAETIEKEHGRLDVLINNAGSMSSDATAFDVLENVNDDQFQLPIQLNVTGRMYAIKRAIPLLLRSPGGAKVIINVGSMSAHFTTGTPIAFNISELATMRLSEAVAEQYKEKGLLVYCVHPGAVRDTAYPVGFPEEFKQGRDDPLLLGAIGLWLVRERPGWLSGRYLSANWDVGELVAKREEIERKDLLKMRMTV